MVNKTHIHPGLALGGVVVTAASGAWGLFVLMLTGLGCMAAETGLNERRWIPLLLGAALALVTPVAVAIFTSVLWS